MTTSLAVAPQDGDTLTLAQIQAKAISLLKTYKQTSEEQRTPVARAVAELLVAARERHTRASDGSPDWGGRSYVYRMFVSDIYKEANFDRDDARTMQNVVAYHAGEMLRTRLSPEELADHGLKPKSPRERNQEMRAMKSAYLGSIASAREGHGGALVGLAAAHVVLRKVDPSDLTGLDRREAMIAADAIAEMKARLEVLERRLPSEG